MAWAVVEIPVPEMAGEAVADALKSAGADGVAEEWRFPVAAGLPACGGQYHVRAFWKDAPLSNAAHDTLATLERLVAAGVLERAPAFTVTTMEDQDWLEGWKQYFSPIEISSRLAITPSWEEFTPREGQAAVILDPGMAFGTGTHGTTYTCLRALSDYLRPGMRVCDVGAGSGILAIAAVKLDAASVVATDNDDLAVRVARENAELNGVGERIDFRVTSLLDGVDGPFDLIIANILAPVIVELIPQLSRVLLPGGLFISSGYIVEQEPDIRAALEQACHRVVQRYERENWVTLVSTGSADL